MINVDVLEDAVRRLVEQFKPMKIILFGSQARESADERSDVDLLVICPISGKKRALMVEMDRALYGLGFARDIIVMTPQKYAVDQLISGTIARIAKQEGRVLYEQDKTRIE